MKSSPILMSFLGIGLALTAPAWAGETDAAKEEVNKHWNVEAMVKQAAKNIGDRYNLNGNQRAQTEAMLVDEVGQFLDTHPEVWPLIRDLTRLQIEGKAPQGEVARRLGEAAQPLLDEMKKAIVNGNMRWRSILTDEQKRTHDYDLKDIDRQFEKMHSNFSQMAEGKADKVRLFPEPTVDPEQPPTPPRPLKGFEAAPDPKPVVPQEDWWDGYVKNFISKYELDEGQSEAALSILRECKERAKSYKSSKASAFAKAEEHLKEARDPKLPPEVQRVKIRLWKQEDVALKKPILDLFQELKDRLEVIPRDAQRKRVMQATMEVSKTD